MLGCGAISETPISSTDREFEGSDAAGDGSASFSINADAAGESTAMGRGSVTF